MVLKVKLAKKKENVRGNGIFFDKKKDKRKWKKRSNTFLFLFVSGWIKYNFQILDC